MKFLKEWIDERINDEDINYFDYNEFSNLEEIGGAAKKANWENRKIAIALKILNLKITENEFKEFISRLKAFCGINHSNINRFLGLTRDLNDKYFSILEYANEGNLRGYFKSKFNILKWSDKIRMALDITSGLKYLHSEKVIHGNLHPYNILVNNGILMIADIRLFKQATEGTSASENIVYIEPQYLRNPGYELDKKSDIYSFGILLWELSSGRPPFSNYIGKAFGLAQIKVKLLNGEREDPVENTPSEYLRLYQKCWQDDPNLRPEINEVYEILSQLRTQFDQEMYDKSLSLTSNHDVLDFEETSDRSSPRIAKINAEIFKSSLTTQQILRIIRQSKLNHGLISTGYSIRPSMRAIVVEDGELKINLRKGQPLVYTYINSEKPLDTCINFPVAEIIYNGNLLKSFLECTDDEEKLHELYGHFLVRKVLVGGQLFIKGLNLATPTQIDMLKFYLFCTYYSAKYSTVIQFSNLFTLNLLPKIETLDGKKLNTHEKLVNWMNNLYQEKMIDIISYNNLISVPQLRRNTSLMDNLETFNEKQPGVINFKEKLSLEEWVGDAVNDNLMSWTGDFHLFQGLIVNKNDEMEISKKIAVNIIEIPNVNLRNESYVKIIKPSVKSKIILISNKIFSIEDLNAFPFIVKSNPKNYEHVGHNDNHILVKCERYEILLNKNDIKPTKEFEQAIERALNSTKPLKALQNVFNEYGHLFPQRIILGKSLKNILPSDILPIDSLYASKSDDSCQELVVYKEPSEHEEMSVLESLESPNITINLKSPIFDSLKSHLDDLNISYLITQKGRIIGKDDLPKWIQNKNNNLEIVEFDNIIPLYKILESEQQKKIDDILKNNFRILMTGITDLKDLDNNNIEHYKRINIETSLEDEDYEVFGSIISENNSKLEEFCVNFGLYDFNGFFAIIKKLEETSIDITKCYVLWIIVGIPSKLSVFSPNNREFQVEYFKKSITLQSNQLNYHIKTPFLLFEGYTISVHAYDLSTNYEPSNTIKLVEWNDEYINVQIIKSTYNGSDPYVAQRDGDNHNIETDLHICILFTDYKSLKIDNNQEKECLLDLIGYVLTKENLNNLFNQIDELDESFSEPVSEDSDLYRFSSKIEAQTDVVKPPFINDIQTKEPSENISIASRSLTYESNNEEKIEVISAKMRNHIFDENSRGPTKEPIIASRILDNSNDIFVNKGNHTLLALEEDGFVTPDDKIEELLKNLTEPKFLYALKILFENTQNEFSSRVLIGSLVALADSTPFNYYSKESVSRLESHLRTFVAVLERIWFSPIRLSRELRDNIYKSLAEFAEIHRKTIVEGLENNFKSNLNHGQQQKNDNYENYFKKRNYNIDFLLIHIRDTLHSLRDDETWFQEILQRNKDILKAGLGITPMTRVGNSSILTMLSQLRQDLSFKYPVASYYVDWRIMLIIRHNINEWSESSEKIISKKFGEMILMEYYWSYIEREWIEISDISILGSQSKFDKLSNKVIKSIKSMKNTESFFNDLAGNEPLALPHTLWFGILDLAQDLIQKSTRTATHGLCYYLAIESLKKAPSSFIQMKAIEILLHLYKINNELFSMVELDFDHYEKKLYENNSTTDSLKKFQNLLMFVKEKCQGDFNILNDDKVGKGKGIGNEKGKFLEQNTHFEKEKELNSSNIINIIADEMTCPITYEPVDQLCVLECQHMVSLNSLKKLKQAKCPICKQKIVNDSIRYLPQNTIYKSLYSQFFEAGHILPSIVTEDSDQVNNDQYNSDSDNSEVDLMIVKTKQSIKSTKLNSNVSLQSVFKQVRNPKKQHPIYRYILKELEEKNYEEAALGCEEFLRIFPKNYSIRCILAYTYKCLNNYEQAHLYLKEAINLKDENPIAYLICGEIFFRQKKYSHAIYNLNLSLNRQVKINNSHIILGNSYLFYGNNCNALEAFNIALQNNPNNHLCLKNCAYIYEEQDDYKNTLQMLDKLLVINENDSLILCYYGEILNHMGNYNEAILYFTKANDIDPENVHILNKRAIVYYIIQFYDKALLDLNKAIELDFSNGLAYYYKGLAHYKREDIDSSIVAFKKCIELDPNDDLAKLQLYYLLDKNNSKDLNYDITKFNQISRINYDKSLLFLRCKIFIELEKYFDAKLDLDRLFILDKEDISFIYLLQKYSDFWSYLYKVYKINDNDFTEFGIVDKFNKLIYKVKNIYSISNLTNLDNKPFYVQDSDSLLGQAFCLKDENFNLNLPKFSNASMNDFHYVVWKINVKKISSKGCFVKFIIKEGKDLNMIYPRKEHTLRYEDVSKLEGLGWIEYTLPIKIPIEPIDHSRWTQPSIEVNKGSINIEIDYVRFKKSFGKQIYFPKMGHSLIHKVHPNVPKAFKGKYFSKKEMKNLLELEDIINNL